MRILLLAVLVVGLVLLAVPAVGDHANTLEKKASSEITITAPIYVAGQKLPADKYRLSCNRHTLTFVALEKDKRFEFPCQGKQLAARAENTELYLEQVGGERVLQKLLLRGSNIEHTF